jgi:hypothetical protein
MRTLRGDVLTESLPRNGYTRHSMNVVWTIRVRYMRLLLLLPLQYEPYVLIMRR